jgi:hypothetical protein
MPLDRVLGQLVDELGDRAVGRRARGRRAGSLSLLRLIDFTGSVVITVLAYTGPLDPTWIAGLDEAADYDDEIDSSRTRTRIRTLAGEAGRSGANDAYPLQDLYSAIRIRSPPP